MAQNEAVLSATVRDYFVKNGGKVKRHDLFDHFRSQLDETSDQGKLKNQFGDIVNSLAVLQSIEGEKYFVLKKTRNGSTPVQFRRAPRGVNQRKDKGVSLPVSMRNFRFSSTDDPPGNLAESRARASSSRAKPPAKSDSLPNNLKRNNSDTSIIVENTGPEDDSGVDTLSSMHSESSSLGSRTDSLTKNTEPDELSQNSGDTGIFGDDDQYDLPSHVLSGLQKSWMMSSMVANKAHLVCLLEESPDVVLFKDFVMGYTALHWAAKQGNEEILRILIQGGADVNAKSNGGYTALHLASMHGKLNIINILIDECSVDVHVRDHSGKEPKDVGKKDMAEEIKQKLKDPVPAIALQEIEMKLPAPSSGKRKKFGKIRSRKHHNTNSIDGETKFQFISGALLERQSNPALLMDQESTPVLPVDEEGTTGSLMGEEGTTGSLMDEEGATGSLTDEEGPTGTHQDRDGSSSDATSDNLSNKEERWSMAESTGSQDTYEDTNSALEAWEREHLE